MKKFTVILVATRWCFSLRFKQQARGYDMLQEGLVLGRRDPLPSKKSPNIRVLYRTTELREDFRRYYEFYRPRKYGTKYGA